MASNDIQAAIERARAVAAKLTSQLPEGNKRSYDSRDDAPSTKKFASVNDAVGQQLQMFKATTLAGSVTEELKVSDNQVGLVIGKGGELLRRFQNEFQCKITIAPENNGRGERVFTIVGARDNIDRCKKAINDLIMCGAAPRPDEPISQALLHNRVEIIEILIPGKRCGLIIGKGGETIKGLAETYGVKLVVIQESDTPLHLDKPLRITGEPEKVARCKEAVLALLNDQNAPVKTTSQAAPTPAVITSDYGTRMHSSNYYKPSQATIKVPWDKTGHVIGRGGDTIRDINKRSGAHVEVQKDHKSLPDGVPRCFFRKGSDDQIEYAKQLIYEKLSGIPGSMPPPGYFEDGGASASASTAAAAAAAAAANPWAAYGASDPNAAWSAYYAQYYAQAAAMAAAPPTPAAAAPAAAATQAAPASAVTNGATTQPDYTQAWVDYYRQMGMHEQAEAILKQQQASGSTVASTNASADEGKKSPEQNGTENGKAENGTAATAPVMAADPYAQWAQYAQYQQYANYYQQQPQPSASEK